MSKYTLATLMIFATAFSSPAFADAWTGAPPAASIPGGPLGPITNQAMATQHVVVLCAPALTPLPCTGAQTPIYAGERDGVGRDIQTPIASLPGGTNGGASVGVLVGGVYSDPSSPTGASYVGGSISLASFAQSATVNDLSTTVTSLNSTVGALGTSFNGLTTTVNGLSTSVTSLNSTVGTLTTSLGALNSTVNVLGVTVGGLQTSVGTLNSTVGSLSTSFNALSSTVGTLGTSVSALSTNVNAMSAQLNSLSVKFSQLQQQAQLQDRDLRQGVAMSLAMDGVGDLGPDEHVAISMNFGTFGGQNGMAAGIAFRASDHLTVNGGIGSGVNGGLVGGRVGARFAW